MTGPEPRSVNFVSRESQCFPRQLGEGNVEIRGKQNSLFPKGPDIAKQMGQTDGKQGHFAGNSELSPF